MRYLCTITTLFHNSNYDNTFLLTESFIKIVMFDIFCKTLHMKTDSKSFQSIETSI